MQVDLLKKFDNFNDLQKHVDVSKHLMYQPMIGVRTIT